jgi:hypothetical protein
VLVAGAICACDKIYADPVTLLVVTRADAGLVATPLAPAPCPLETTENSPCYEAAAICEYGKRPDPTCNSLWACVTDPAYGMYWTEQRRGGCSATCPSASAIALGAPCELVTGDGGPSDDGELACTTPDRGTCACTTGPDGAHAHPRRWVCVKPDEDCPVDRPLLGHACVGEHRCDYGACAFARGTLMVCDGGVWRIEAATCP